MANNPIIRPSTEVSKTTEQPDSEDDHLRRAVAEIELRPETATTKLLLTLNPAIGTDAITVYEELRRQTEAIAQGDTTGVIAALMSQSIALSAIFTDAVLKMDKLGAGSAYHERYTLIALRAQNQARMTLVDAAKIASPKPTTTFVKAVAQNQQINVGGKDEPKQVSGKNMPKLENELNDGGQDAAAMDRRATPSTSSAHPTDPTVEEGDWAAGYEPD